MGRHLGRRQGLRAVERAEGWVEAAAFMGEAYLRYSFTKGTEQEVDFLVDALGLPPGARVLDVGCGPGRHAWALAARGIEVVGVDLAPVFVAAACQPHPGISAPPAFMIGDACRLPVVSGAFDAAISLCQGGFGLVGDNDGAVLAEITAALRPGGRIALSAFSAYFTLRHLEEGDTFDAVAGRTIEQTVIRHASGEGEAAFELVAGVFTPRELRLMVRAAGLHPLEVWSVAPGSYRRDPPDLDHPELLLVAEVSSQRP